MFTPGLRISPVGMFERKASARSRRELIAALSGKRYPAARVSRLCACALLGITAGRLRDLPLPDSALLLAMKKDPPVTGPWKNSPVRVASAADWMKAAGPEDLAAWRLWGLCAGLPAGFPFTQKLVTG